MSFNPANASKYVSIAINHAKIDDGLVDFPIAIDLLSFGGSIFTDLGANKLKLAVTTSDGVQCYVEIECWDDINHKGVLHVKVPALSSTVSTYVNLYWDSTQDDNTDYVGETGSTPAKAVWDDDFVAVYHMAQDPSGGTDCILDSTSNIHHGTPNGSMTSDDLVDGEIGKALDFDGSDDYIQTTLNLISMPITVEVSAAELLYTSTNTFIGCSVNNSFQFRSNTDGYLTLLKDHVVGIVTGSVSLQSEVFTNVAVTYTGTIAEVFVSGVSDTTNSDSQTFNGGDIRIGASYHVEEIFGGKIAEARISVIVRSDAWIKATNASLKNELLTAGNRYTLNSKVITIFATQVDEDLSDFPIAIDLDVHVSEMTKDDEYTKLLIHSNTTDGSVVFKDSSLSKHTITAVGNVHHEIDQKKFGDTSIYFDGDGDSFSIPASNEFVFGVDDFTVDFMLYPIVLSGDIILYTGETTGDFFVGIESGVNIGCGQHGVIWDVKITHDMSINQWYHIVLTRIAGVVYVYINGVEKGHVPDTIDYVSSGSISIATQAEAYYFNGYIDEFRISKGIARWTEDFTPPTVPYGYEKKFAIGSTDETEQYPVEIECWELNNHVIHTKIPFISSTVDTEFKLFWDDTQPDNDEYVGETGSLPAQEVWDADFVAVYHMAQDPSGGTDCILDSTSNIHHGTPQGSMTSDDLVDNNFFGKAIDFDGVDDGLTGDPLGLSGAMPFTKEVFTRPREWETNNRTLLSWGSTGEGHAAVLKFGGSPDDAITHYFWGGLPYDLEIAHISLVDAFHNVSSTYDGITQSILVDGVSIGSLESGAMVVENNNFGIGFSRYNAIAFLDGLIASIRISKVDRSDAWLKATNASLKGILLQLSSISGVVTEDSTYVARVLRLYNRETGAFVKEIVSSAIDGVYSFQVSDEITEYYVIALDDAAGTDYNALIQDRLTGSH